MTSPAAVLIDQPDALLDVCAALQSLDWVALDTEFLREDTYYPRLCLLQLGWPDGVVCIDPLRIPDLAPLFAALARPTLLKVLHACRQDLEVLHHLSGQVIAPIFDTQIAAPLLGLPEQLGYGALVERRLGLSIDKAHTRADWSRRPLPAAWLDYAGDDVRHLAALYPGLRDELIARERLGWLEAPFARLVDPASFIIDPDHAWQRLRGAERMNPRQRGALARITAWRERTAREVDRPRGWLIKDESLLDIARALPMDREALGSIRGLSERVVGRYCEALLREIAAGTEQPLSQEASPRRPQSSARAEARVDAAMAVVRLLAAEADVNPSLLASRKSLELWLEGEEESGWLDGWRGSILARGLNDFRNGRLVLRIGPEGLELAPVETESLA